HMVEPPDVWTSTVAEADRQTVPHIRKSARGYDIWFVGDTRIDAIGTWGICLTGAALGEDVPHGYEDVPLPARDASARLSYMDEHGAWAQVLYPSLGLFGLARQMTAAKQGDLAHHCIRTYNDWVSDWARPSNGRLAPLTILPLWDLEASL